MTDGSILPQRVDQGRAACYLLFARCLREAPSETLDSAEDPRWPLQAEEIAVEYARLFAVPGEQAVHPYESAYCDTLFIDTSTACSAYFESQRPLVGLPGFTGGPSASAVARAYAESGFELDPAAHELPDHISIELEFMGRLLERGDVEQAETFFTAHLGRWVFRCLSEIRQATQAQGFYRAVADALVAFLERDQGRPQS